MRDAGGDFPISWVCFGLGSGHSPPPPPWSRGLPFPVSAGHFPPSMLLKHHQGLLFLTNLISFLVWFGRICLCYGVRVLWLPRLPVASGLICPGRATPVKALAGLEASSQFCSRATKAFSKPKGGGGVCQGFCKLDEVTSELNQAGQTQLWLLLQPTSLLTQQLRHYLFLLQRKCNLL